MQKSLLIVPMSLLVISLMAPLRGFADDDDNARHDEHQDLRRARQQLEKLRREGHEEIREHDRDDAHDDNSRAHVQRRDRDMDRDKRDLRRDEDDREGHDKDQVFRPTILGNLIHLSRPPDVSLGGVSGSQVFPLCGRGIVGEWRYEDKPTVFIGVCITLCGSCGIGTKC